MTTETIEYNLMDKLPQDVQDIIYRNKFELEYNDVVDQLNKRFIKNRCCFCGGGLYKYLFGGRCSCCGGRWYESDTDTDTDT